MLSVLSVTVIKLQNTFTVLDCTGAASEQLKFVHTGYVLCIQPYLGPVKKEINETRSFCVVKMAHLIGRRMC